PAREWQAAGGELGADTDRLYPVWGTGWGVTRGVNIVSRCPPVSTYDTHAAMKEEKPESVYFTARRHIVWTVIAMFAIMWGVPLVLSAFGLSSSWILAVFSSLALAWALIGGIRCMLIACPTCQKSLFMRGIVSVPWPAKRCSRCGSDLTQVSL
ncbi:MAG: hypothetical protein OSA39_07065, partial [Sphingobium sp.]|nr:hypothetical protein [Sphingobium sp.]